MQEKGEGIQRINLGFCIFNSIAGVAKLVEDLEGKAIIMDFDAHHGNGTQEIFWNDPNVIHIDLHEGISIHGAAMNMMLEVKKQKSRLGMKVKQRLTPP